MGLEGYYSIPSYHIALSYYSKYVYSNAPAPSRPLNTERLEQSMNGETFATSFLGHHLQHTQIHNPQECAIFALCLWAKIWISSPLTVNSQTWPTGFLQSFWHENLDFFGKSLYLICAGYPAWVPEVHEVPSQEAQRVSSQKSTSRFLAKNTLVSRFLLPFESAQGIPDCCPEISL